MKLLLTSAGITNKSIARALQELTQKPFKETSFLFIPTAMNVEGGGKEWFVKDMNNFLKLEPKVFDIIDFASVSRDVWRKRIQEADVVIFGGGNTFYLMDKIKESGLSEEIRSLLQNKVYVGISAGSIIASKTISISESEKLYSEDIKGYEDDKGLGFVSFQMRVHLNSPHFPKVIKEYIEELAKELSEPVYAIDDQTALKIVNNTIEVVSEGEWYLFK